MSINNLSREEHEVIINSLLNTIQEQKARIQYLSKKSCVSDGSSSLQTYFIADKHPELVEELAEYALDKTQDNYYGFDYPYASAYEALEYHYDTEPSKRTDEIVELLIDGKNKESI